MNFRALCGVLFFNSFERQKERWWWSEHRRIEDRYKVNQKYGTNDLFCLKMLCWHLFLVHILEKKILAFHNDLEKGPNNLWNAKMYVFLHSVEKSWINNFWSLHEIRIKFCSGIDFCMWFSIVSLWKKWQNLNVENKY